MPPLCQQCAFNVKSFNTQFAPYIQVNFFNHELMRATKSLELSAVQRMLREVCYRLQ